MVTALLEFARAHGYKKMYLDVYYVDKQAQAVTFYKKVGFHECEPYNDEPAELWMVKEL